MKIGAKIRWIKSCTSTNDLAKAMVLEGEGEGTVAISDEQTQGKGTKGRSWHSARKKGLYLSIILKPSLADISLLPLVAGLAATEAIFKSAGIRIRLKWPNDLVWGKKKLGGILCESSFSGERVNYVILGIGLNVSHEKSDFPEEIRQQATSLRLILKKDVDKKTILQNLWCSLDYWYEKLLNNEREKITSEFQEYSILSLGENFSVITERGEVTGIYAGIDLQGRLILERERKKRALYSAEIKTIKNDNMEG